MRLQIVEIVSMNPLINIAIKAARAASKVILQYRDRIDSIEISEKQKNDFVTQVDQQAERVITEIIGKAYPGHNILAEEGNNQDNQHDVTWVIDPLDGTRNYIHGIPHYAVSIGIIEKGLLQHGLVYQPLSDEIFMASRGQGARLNDHRIRVASRTSLAGSLVATGFPFRNTEQLTAYLTQFKNILTDTWDIRRCGSAALDLCYVACGRLDAYWEYNLAPWDIAAGALIVLESGGIVYDTDGANNYLDSGNIVAGNLKIAQALLNKLHLSED